MTSSASPAPARRHYGMDWLRIAAFALLILYHVGMVFVSWDFHVNWHSTPEWVKLPMLATNGWRLTLLFVVSGYASAALLAKLGGAAFFRSRCARLLIPLAFGIVVVVPPQPWVEMMFKYGYTASFWQFWSEDYFRFGTMNGIVLPTWQHLWFVVYLFAYTAIFSLIRALMPLSARRWTAETARAALSDMGLFIVPIVYLAAKTFLLFPGHEDTHAFFDDLPAHFVYMFAFLFGLLLRDSPEIWRTIGASWKGAAFVSLVTYATVVAMMGNFSGRTELDVLTVNVFEGMRIVQAWTAIIALIGVADRFLNADAPGRILLNEAVFPFYIVHQTIIILVCWWLLPLPIGGFTAFLLLVAATVIGCWLFYFIGRDVPGLRVLIGLKGWSRRHDRSGNSTRAGRAAPPR